MITDEPVVVWTTEVGVPERLEWRDRRWVVCAKPARWFDHVPWWRVTARAPQGEGDGLLEQPMWRVQAMDTETGDVVRVDLAVGVEHGWWRVTGVLD